MDSASKRIASLGRDTPSSNSNVANRVRRVRLVSQQNPPLLNQQNPRPPNQQNPPLLMRPNPRKLARIQHPQTRRLRHPRLQPQLSLTPPPPARSRNHATLSPPRPS